MKSAKLKSEIAEIAEKVRFKATPETEKEVKKQDNVYKLQLKSLE